MSFIVDCQSHVFPHEYAELLTRNRNSLRTSGGDGVYLIDYGGVQRFRLDLDDYSPARKLADMDRSGVDMSVISVNIPTPDMLEPKTGAWRARASATTPSPSSARGIAIASSASPRCR